EGEGDDGSTAHGHGAPLDNHNHASTSSLHSPHSPPAPTTLDTSSTPNPPAAAGYERSPDGFAYLTHARDDSLSAWAAALGGSHRRADSVVEAESRRDSRISFDDDVEDDGGGGWNEGAGRWREDGGRVRDSRITLDSRADPRASMAVLNPRDSIVSFDDRRASVATFNQDSFGQGVYDGDTFGQRILNGEREAFNPRDSTATLEQSAFDPHRETFDAQATRRFNAHASMAVLNPRDSVATLDQEMFNPRDSSATLDQDSFAPNPRESVASAYSDESASTQHVGHPTHQVQASLSSLQQQLASAPLGLGEEGELGEGAGAGHKPKPSLASSISSSLAERIHSPPSSASGPLPSPYSNAALPSSASVSTASPLSNPGALASPPPTSSTLLAPPPPSHPTSAEEQEDQGTTGIGLSLLQSFGADSSDEDSSDDDAEATLDAREFPAPPAGVPTNTRTPPGSAGFRSPHASVDFRGVISGRSSGSWGRPGSSGAGMVIGGGGGGGGGMVQSPPPMVRSPPPALRSPPPTTTSALRSPPLPSTPPAHSPPFHTAHANPAQSPTISTRSKRSPSLNSASFNSASDDEGDDDSYWDGAGDIYDDYRYSRASMLSKASKKSTRSAHSHHNHNHHWVEDMGGPPSFPEELRRPSLDSVRPILSRLNTDESGATATTEGTGVDGDREDGEGEIGIDVEADDASVYSRSSLPPPALPNTATTKPLTLRSRPAPLTVSNSNGHSGVEVEGESYSYRTSTSPLLHTTFGLNSQHMSLNSAHSAHSGQEGDETSPLLHGSFGSPGGELSPLPNSPYPAAGEQGLPTPVTPHGNAKEGGAVRRSLMAERQMSDSTVASSSSTAHETALHSNEGTLGGREITPLERVLNKTKEALLDSPLIVVNPAPAPPPYASAEEEERLREEQRRARPVSSEATFHDMPTPVVPPSPTTPNHRTSGQGALPSVLTPGAGLPAVPLPPVLPPGSAPQLRPRATSNAHDPATRQSLFGSSRTSVFAPHPNAPKPALAPTGPMYGRIPLPSQHILPAAQTLIQTMRAAAAGKILPNGMRKPGTVYGAIEGDLLGSSGPVGVRWSNEPVNDVPANRIRRVGSEVVLPGPGRMAGEGEGVPGRSASAQAHVSTTSGGGIEGGKGAPALIPRANFYPKAGAPRPRSRSFSSLESPYPMRGSSKDANVPQDDSAIVAANPSPAPSSHNPRGAAARVRQYSHTPSPLALQQTTASAPTSPLMPPARPGSAQQPSSLPGSPRLPKHPSPLTIDVSSPPTIPASRAPIVDSPTELRSPTEVRSPAADSPVLPRQSTDTHNTSPTRRRRESERTRRTSGDSNMTHASEASGLTAGSPRRSSSLRSKLSFSALRATTSREAPSEGQNTVQVQDTDFELVVPNVPALPSSRGSEDSPVLPRPSPSFDGSMLRADSPAMSLASSLPRSPISPKFSPGPPPPPPPSSGQQTHTAGRASIDNVEAHRQRESKWVALLGATKPADARKNKKVRKLLQEGVPASVRYQVWAHLTDSKSKRLEGLYARLCARGKVAASAVIERDVRECFAGDARLADPQALVNLLQAYLVMVPDIQYQRGLTYIAGQLLMQSPEEDAFWIFITLMDTHLRPYFAANSAQLEVDAALFARAVEAADPAVGKRLFTDYSIPPVDVVRPWFTSLFVEALPSEYFQRIWDIFLSEGVVFLFRAGMAVLTCTRRTLLDTKGADACLALLRRPPQHLIADRTPDALVELALAAKLKDDDVRKQRIKMEAAVKLQTQHTRKPQGAAGSSPAISLPNRT
ncbi:unnamed protein product, partial [Peniophora sp. CBMAI 1063]